MYNEIKWGFQRMFRGYDDRIQWGFDDYFSQFIPPLKEFCVSELKEEHIANGNNPESKEVYEKTLKLINKYETAEFGMPASSATFEMWKYVGAHLGYYWN